MSSIRKTTEYRNAMKAHKACYGEEMTGPKLSTRIANIFRYQNSLKDLASRLLKDEGVHLHYINIDQVFLCGQTYYEIDFGNARSLIASMAANCGVKIPSFRFMGAFEFSVDMTPDDVLCEVRQCLRDRDNEVEMAKDLIVSTVENKKTLQAAGVDVE